MQPASNSTTAQRGQAELSYILILAFVIIPLYGVGQLLLQVLQRYYENISYVVTLPFP